MSNVPKCPFCGNAPKVDETRDSGPGIWDVPKPWPAVSRACAIRCCDTHVYFSSETKHFSDEEKCRVFVRENAMRRWSRRVDSDRIAELERQVAELRNACTMAHKFLQEQPRSERQADVLRFVDAALAQAKTEGA